IDALLDAVSAPDPVADAPADVTDPGDIDALLDAVSAPDPVADAPAEVTGPDDIDALLDAASAPDPVADAPAEVTDPDDIDALLDAASGHSATKEPSLDNDSSAEVPNNGNDTAEQAVNTDESLRSAEDQKVQNEISENEAKIAEFTAEYVTPFLTADFSDILAKEEQQELASEEVASDDDSHEQEGSEEDIEEDIGESLTGYVNDDLSNASNNESISEVALSQLLTDEDLNEDEISASNTLELAPDFSDEDVLAELLAETAGSEEDEPKRAEESSAKEVIEELDNVDFDELLANIEEEATQVEQDEADLMLDIGDDLFDASTSKESSDTQKESESETAYVSVDDLLSETLDEIETSEPYEKTNIDVGLDQFAENDTNVDVDKDGTISSKLDLAKMYIEMGDEENAQVELQAVISKGDERQQSEAQALLESL
ncbi:MAG: hypothetical protein GY928_20475, partial [Colwellia sp.]|nr:hypothetical protein [Colwellia sp.]